MQPYDNRFEILYRIVELGFVLRFYKGYLGVFAQGRIEWPTAVVAKFHVGNFAFIEIF